MKKLILFLSAIILLFANSSCKKEEIKEDEEPIVPVVPANDLTPDATQWAFMGLLTSTTCGICGGSGYQNFNSIKQNNSGKVVALAFHCNSPDDAMVNNALYGSYVSSRPSGGGIPSFHIGDDKTTTSGMQPYVTVLLSRIPEAQVKFKTAIEGEDIKVTSKIKFFKEVTGDYYVSFYLCENGIDGSSTAPAGYVQSGGGAGYKHNNVVRSANKFNSAYGVKITTAATTAANTVFDYECTIAFSTNWNIANLFVTAVIWKKNPDNSATCQYLFVNGWDKQVYN